MGSIGTYERTAAVREGIVVDEEVVVRTGAEIDEVCAGGAVLDDIAFENEVLDVGDGFPGVVVQGFDAVQVAVADRDRVGDGAVVLVLDEE